ncbi:hypothetical protein V2J09_009071 [Rumex salicifolius]
MADSSKDELLQLIKRVGAYLTVKMSNLFSTVFHKLDTRSAGAIAGLAIAIVFSWRLLRSPNNAQRRIPKRPGARASSSGIDSQPNRTLMPAGISSPSEDSGAQNVVDNFFHPIKPTLAQIVRQKLFEARKVIKCAFGPTAVGLQSTRDIKLAEVECPLNIVSLSMLVTCRLGGVILEESSPEELQKQATVKSSVLEVLLEITKYCDLYLMETVLDDESEKRVLTALEVAGVFSSGGLIKDKVLFCSTEVGRTSFVRQLEPEWHIDTNAEVVSQLARFIKYQLVISASRPERAASNVFSSPSLEQFFGCA